MVKGIVCGCWTGAGEIRGGDWLDNEIDQCVAFSIERTTTRRYMVWTLTCLESREFRQHNAR